MRHTISGPEQLPVVKGRYVRCSSEPTVVTHPTTGDAYVRTDGAPWEHHGYKFDDAGKVLPAMLQVSPSGVCTVADTAAAECDAYWRERRKQEKAA